MDPLTHALASYSLARSAFPRLSAWAQGAVVLAGIAPSADFVAAYFGPSAYLQFHRTATHAVLAVVVFAILFTAIGALCKSGELAAREPAKMIFAATFLAGWVHLALDLCQNEAIVPLWPFSLRRYQLDWVAHIDLIVLAILVAGVLLPLLVGLVTEEIGARSKAPRGRTGATIALVLIAAYIGARGILHTNAVATLNSRSYGSESARRSGALADAVSPFRWHGIVETESALHALDISVGPLAQFDPESAATVYKPEPSPALESARNTVAAQIFLRTVRFPKASVERTVTGNRVELRDFAFATRSVSGRNVTTIIEMDPAGQVLDSELVWDRMSRSTD